MSLLFESIWSNFINVNFKTKININVFHPQRIIDKICEVKNGSNIKFHQFTR